MISLNFEFFSEYELSAFFASFFKFVDTVSAEEANSIILSTNLESSGFGRKLTFETESLAAQFSSYWQQRKAWLGIDHYEQVVI